MGTHDFEHDLLDAAGLSPDLKRAVIESRCMPELVLQQIQALIADSHQKGCLQVSPPLVSRAIAEVSVGMQAYESALSIAHFPFPYPYLIVTEVVLVAHLLYTPFEFSLQCRGPFGTGFWTF